MAALRNTTIGLLRRAGYSNMAAAFRLVAAQPARALALIGIERENQMILARRLVVSQFHVHSLGSASWIEHILNVNFKLTHYQCGCSPDS